MDGTLTLPVQPMTEDMKEVLLRCKNRGYDIALASGSNYPSIRKQIGKDFVNDFNYIFSENGTQVYQRGTLVDSLDIRDVLPEKVLKELVEFSLIYIANLDIPVKRGTFVEFRRSLINLCPVGRNCSDKERQQFAALDKERNIRGQFIEELKKRFGSGELALRFVAGGQISIDVFPKPWTKALCITHLKDYEEIHFFGDNTHEGGNDYEICHHPDVIGHTVKNYKDLIVQLNQLIG
ncbi:phosphomannomutase [Babesia ovata]|uniref:Phosphomannomutase n=1 Tax=Babesia ovata TaxID=189622 RepID=A0A2H6KBM5_9APIC|nr:phosphomannomutase [Babesia ovata]GBE60398.1 phosphomannomutase [Babesia ovata]